MLLAGVDGCRGGWICVMSDGETTTAFVASSFTELLRQANRPDVLAIDIPIGLTDKGERRCDPLARSLLGQPRGSSVFPAPVRAALLGRTYPEACSLHEQADGRRMTRQAFGILAKIREVDDVLSKDATLQRLVYEIHPEVSFAVWNEGRPMRHRKAKPDGRAEREALIDQHWPGLRGEVRSQLVGRAYKTDDLNDALAAFWTAERIHGGTAKRFPENPGRDQLGLVMQMRA